MNSRNPPQFDLNCFACFILCLFFGYSLVGANADADSDAGAGIDAGTDTGAHAGAAADTYVDADVDGNTDAAQEIQMNDCAGPNDLRVAANT